MYFFRKTQTSDNPRTPSFIKGGALCDCFMSDPFSDSEFGYDWHTGVYSVHDPIDKALSFPDELWLNTGCRKLELDLYPDHNGLIFSESFMNILSDTEKAALKIASLHIVNRKGKSIVAKEMFYAKYVKRVYAIDALQTKGETDINSSTGKKRKLPNGNVRFKHFDSIVLSDTIDQGEMLQCWDLSRDWWLMPNKTAEQYLELGLNGAEVYTLTEFSKIYGNAIEAATLSNLYGIAPE